jgi:RNA polymerase sigma-70 factor (ECF subfamily)
MLEDKILLWKFKRGNRDAFRLIYDKYADGLLNLAANLLADRSQAEDVVQDVFISFVESIDKFRLTGSLKGYLATCTANRSRDYIRKKMRERTAAENLPERTKPDVKNPLRLAANSEELHKLSHALTELPYEQLETLVLHLHGGMRFRQIAGIQNVSMKTAQSRYRYGLEKLRSALNSDPLHRRVSEDAGAGVKK